MSKYREPKHRGAGSVDYPPNSTRPLTGPFEQHLAVSETEED